MSSGITATDQMFSVREMPWHGLGKILQDAPSVRDALLDAELTWQVDQQKVQFFDTFGVLTEVPGYLANIRSDTQEVLGIVSDRYNVQQNWHRFTSIEAAIGTELFIETAGSLHGGKKVWMLARMPDSIEIAGDKHYPYIFCYGGHDGRTPETVKPIITRAVCANTVAIALREKTTTWTGKHTASLDSRRVEIRRVLDITYKMTEDYKAEMEQLDRIQMAGTALTKFVDTLAPKAVAGASKRAVTLANTKRDIFHSLIYTAETQQGHRGTGYGLFQAGVEYLDWFRPVRGGNEDEVRMDRNLIDSDGDKRKVLELVRSVA